jgi:hypothetical protein
MMMEKPEGAPHPRLLLWTLLVVYIFNFIDRQIVAILAEPISRDLQLSDSQLGLLTGLAFGFFAPYLERDCLRSLTPCKSSEPRTM